MIGEGERITTLCITGRLKIPPHENKPRDLHTSDETSSMIESKNNVRKLSLSAKIFA